jgi:hypothetical protein
MIDFCWNQNERWWAKHLTKITGLEARRLPINGRGNQPDVEHPLYPTECKERKVIPQWLLKALRQADGGVTTKEQTPIVQVHMKNTPHTEDFICIRLSNFEKLIDPNKR